ncbi:MAG: N-methylhydantoinase A/acetone carboxylase, beta subunit [Deltaproteobacteria bacterium]|nr:N-methylhydantoinase A/acetone carboxylase, beta subunit [Deltaproteobacteria bacterium]
MALHVAVDIGGTFTDLIGYDDETGHVFSAKSSSTPTDLTRGIMRCLDKSRMAVPDLVNFVHGSTVAINTVIERKGASTALIVTKGTRDVYKIGRGNRPEAYDLFFKRPIPLVPRHLTFEVEERLFASGEVALPFNQDQARAIVTKVAASEAEAVAVCFIHSWVNASHEALLGELLRSICPEKYTSLSHEILREYGEYERISTTVLNAYIGPRVSTYVGDLERILAAQGFSGSLLIMQSNGGVMSPETASVIPVAMLESGPVGGFIAAAHVGKRLGFENVIGFDMGGTTAKTNLVKDGVPQLAHGYYIGGYVSGHPMMLPVVDTIEIGAGGGSIAWVDDVGALRVGPRSAGAEPGPICYGRGGTEPTITDANLVLGRLSPSEFLGGEMPLDVERARLGIAEKVGSKTGVSDIEAALAITKIAVMNMSLAVRGVSVERGYDPRDFAMIAFGGAGGLHAVEVARELHIPTVIVPNYPGQFSALGMLMADIQHDYVQTYYRSLAQTDFAALQRICDGLIEQGRLRLKRENVSADAMFFQRFLDIRYAGQDFSIPVPVPADHIEAGDTEAIKEAFNEVHERRYGYHTPEHALEIVNVRVSAMGRRKQIELPVPELGGSDNPLAGKRMVYFESGAMAVECPIFSRERLAPGYKLAGPAVIQEYACTTVLFPGDSLVVADTGELVITIKV